MKLKFLFIIIFISTVCFAQVDLTQGLMAYYPFTGNANDASGNNNNPNFNNATLTTDRYSNVNSAYNFNGIDNYMRIPNSPTLNPGAKISLCVWVKPKGFFQGACHGNAIIMKDDDAVSGFYQLTYSDGAYINFTNCSTIPVDETHQNFYGPSTFSRSGGYKPFIEINKWYSVVYTYDGTKARTYVNCQLVDSNIVSLNFSNTYDLFLGEINSHMYPNLKYWLNADLDEVRIYNRALNLDEIKLYGDCIVAPVIINHYTAVVSTGNFITLKWDVSQEIDIKNYTIERSINGISEFISIGNIDALNNSTNTKYSFNDKTLLPGENYYYRIVINEKNGIKKYSDIKKIASPGNFKNFYVNIYPNSSNKNFNISITNNTEKATLVVINDIGQMIYTKKINNSEILDLSNQPKGTYWVKIFTSKDYITKKIIKL